MSWRSIENHNGFSRICPVQFPQKDLKALPVETRQVQAKALSGCGLDGYV
jgi:hypothetical protein